MPVKTSPAHTLPEQGDARPLKLRDEAFIALERMIVNGTLAPGQWVSETDLIEASGHTRASVRSAIQKLADQELVSISPRRGAQICPIDFTKQFRALELRRVVERLVARSAAKRATAVQREAFAEFEKGFREAAKTVDQKAMTELDSGNFALMLEAADNPFAARALRSVKGLSRRFWILHRYSHGDPVQMAIGHADVAAAIAEGDVDEADQAVSRLVDYIEKFTLEVVGYSASGMPGS
ncbi:MAG: GntR family transcriptional regulator [Alphaproteobacteria bacterium]|nr:GntR family transcriptional regulator [Alphaproteobacteria bacterium]